MAETSATDLSGFPSCVLSPSSLLHRVHRAERAWLHFSVSRVSRFDVPQGTAYFGEEPLGGLLETARGLTLLSPEWRRSRQVTTVEVPEACRLADTTDARAYSFGYTLAVSTGPDYGGSQAYAGSFRDSGFDGIRYFLRHDVTGTQYGVALFGGTTLAAALERVEVLEWELNEPLLASAAPYGIRPGEPLPAEAEPKLREEDAS